MHPAEEVFASSRCSVAGSSIIGTGVEITFPSWYFPLRSFSDSDWSLPFSRNTWESTKAAEVGCPQVIGTSFSFEGTAIAGFPMVWSVVSHGLVSGLTPVSIPTVVTGLSGYLKTTRKLDVGRAHL